MLCWIRGPINPLRKQTHLPATGLPVAINIAVDRPSRDVQSQRRGALAPAEAGCELEPAGARVCLCHAIFTTPRKKAPRLVLDLDLGLDSPHTQLSAL